MPLAGRCPANGHEINAEGDEITFTCLCPGRADGIYAAHLGVAPVRVAIVAGAHERITGLANIGKLDVADNRPVVVVDAAVE